ncbi:carbohydrate-binding domain-containing protein [Demequina sp.]|uniref:carbohydrate-binding domain-containing protein n=1 Tax=Demequina sp. TaxID=2050685 RepID=UPI0025E18B9B|nr:carbohydrate-binding domain-containing protein [Demequina sp.]
MRKPTLLFAGLLTGTLMLAGCTATGTATDTATGDATATTTTVEEAQTVSASTDALTEVSYEELGVKDVDIPFDESAAVAISLSDSGSTGGDGVTVAGDVVTITAGGTYVLSGTLSAGQVVVDTEDEDVNLILDGVDITSSDTAALDIEGADEVVIWLAEGSTNSLADAAGATASTDAESGVPNATLYSTANLWIAGTGSLAVDAVAEDGITSKDGLVIDSGTISVTAADDGIRGKDHLVISGGDITVDAGGDGLKSNNEDIANDDGEAVGVIWISGGTLDVTAASDALDAARQVTVEGGDLALAADDDGIHSDGVLHVSDGSVDISTSYEGLEGGVIILSGGTGSITSSDDGVNVSGGSSSGGGMDAGGMGGTRPDRGTGMPGQDTGATDGAVTDGATTGTSTGTSTATTDSATAVTAAYTTDTTTASSDGATDATTVAGGGMDQAVEGRYLEITGGTWYIDADGDGLDSNGSASMTGGTVVVAGPTGNGNGALDVNGTFDISGGTLAAAGSSGMLVSPDAAGDQGVLTVAFASTVAEGTVITVTDADGEHVASFVTTKSAQSLVLSTPGIVTGDSYTISVGGTVSGDDVDGLVLDGTSTGGDQLGTVTAN